MEQGELRRLYASVTKLSSVVLSQEQKRFINVGVVIPDPDAVYLSTVTAPEMVVGNKTIISPHVYLLGTISIGKRCIIGPGITLCNVNIGNDVVIGRPQFMDVIIEDGAKLGRFTEIVRSYIGKGSAAQHLSYIGDTRMGNYVNVGAGFVSGNFDGENKNTTVIEDGAFPGINSSVVAPITLGKESCLGAGAVATRDVPPHAIVIGANHIVERKTWHRTPNGWRKETHQPL